MKPKHIPINQFKPWTELQSKESWSEEKEKERAFLHWKDISDKRKMEAYFGKSFRQRFKEN